tara:strand:+ start:1242 stop:2402 length:1161 start_codon:yes stop_codon:yes gene_type:complete
MKLKLKNTPEQVELIKAMGSRSSITAREAQEAFAAFLGPVVQEVIHQAGTAGSVYTDAPYDEDDSPSYPLDLYYNDGTDTISVWSQNMAGGLPSSQVEGMSELKIATYRLDSAVSYLKKYARRARLDVISKGVERMAQEVLVKQERNAWAVILKALGEASSSGVTAGGLGISSLKAGTHVIPAGTESTFQLADLNKLMTLNKRINESFAAGTPDVAYSQGITDLYVSPEIKEQIRAFAYQPMNTRHGAVTSSGASSIPLPDNVRTDIYNSAGTQEIYGVNIVELNELGIGKKYNVLFDSFDSGNIGPDGSGGAHGFAVGTDELVVGIHNSKGAFIRALAQNADSGSTFNAEPDDQFVQRQEKIGFYGSLEEGRVCIDGRAVVGLIV